jgi:hypothetical protein
MHLCHLLRPESNALLHEKCAAVTEEVLNILIFAAPLHLVIFLSLRFKNEFSRDAVLGFPHEPFNFCQQRTPVKWNEQKR